MGVKTGISYVDSTWSPVRGCTHVSEGCRNCWAERMAARRLPGLLSPTTGKPFAEMRTIGPLNAPWMAKKEPRWTGDIELIESQLEIPLYWRKPRRIFVNSMSDTFHEALPARDRLRIFQAAQAAPQHQYLFLTKRPRIMRDFMIWWAGSGDHVAPPANWWFGVSVEDQQTADERIPLLLQTPGESKFISLEPMLESVDLHLCDEFPSANGGCYEDARHGIRLVIVGGETGPGARPMHPDWARSVRRQCKESGTPFFMKQFTEHGCNIPFDEWAKEDQVREFPGVRASAPPGGCSTDRNLLAALRTTPQ